MKMADLNLANSKKITKYAKINTLQNYPTVYKCRTNILNQEMIIIITLTVSLRYLTLFEVNDDPFPPSLIPILANYNILSIVTDLCTVIININN